ncbi:MAG: peptide MFS transporter [Pseudomonadales bacterium]
MDTVLTNNQTQTPLRQPPGLVVLFFAEMWERFSYYGMRALLVFYLTKHWLFDDATATGIYASYGSLVYLTPILGGLIADRWLGFRRAVILGGCLLVMGHLGMAIEGEPARWVAGEVVRDDATLQVFYLSLALIITGVGFLKPNISSIVGALYARDDPRRDAGFTLFYMGINVGAMVSALVCGWLGETYGWRYGFGLAGVGMVAGLVTFLRGRDRLQGVGEAPVGDALFRPLRGRLRLDHCIYLGTVAGVVVAWWLMQHRAMVGGLLTLGSLVAVGGIIGFSVLKCTPEERNRMLLVLFLTSVSVLFWALFEQAGSSMNLFADRIVDRSVGGVEITASQLQSLNPFFIIVLAPLFARLWTFLGGAGREPSTGMKFALALLQVGLGFVVLLEGIRQVDANGHVALLWLVGAYLLHTTGELCLSPVGLSMVTRLSVSRIVGLMMGVWFLSSSAAAYVGGLLAGIAAADAGAADGGLSNYVTAFELAAKVGIAAGVVLILLVPLLKRMVPPGGSAS